jgi:hypothetical protein
LDWIWAIGGTGFVRSIKEGHVLEEGTLGNTRECLSELSCRYGGALIVMEAVLFVSITLPAAS